MPLSMVSIPLFIILVSNSAVYLNISKEKHRMCNDINDAVFERTTPICVNIILPRHVKLHTVVRGESVRNIDETIH